MKLKDVLRDKLGKEELELVPRAFDIVGDVAIIEVPPELKKRKRDIALALKKLHPRVKTVCNKTGERSGKYRLPSLEVLVGKETETEHIEYGCRFRVDVGKAYFSGREGTERQRIAGKVKPGERVLVMFSGVCPSPIIIAKKQPKIAKVYGVEINPEAVEYARENIRMNRVPLLVEALCGDVRDVCPGLVRGGNRFDRIVMPLPKGAHEFLDVALKCVKKNGIIHFYHWDREDDLYTKALKIIENECKKAGLKCRILEKRKVLPYGPRIWKICIDFRVL
jgi:tRNA (guanine37-N1)-methyltransferase